MKHATDFWGYWGAAVASIFGVVPKVKAVTSYQSAFNLRAVGADQCESRFWWPDWQDIESDAPELNKLVLVQLWNGSTMPARRVGCEVTINSPPRRGMSEAVSETDAAITRFRAKYGDYRNSSISIPLPSDWRTIRHIFESIDGAEIINRVRYWAEFKGESVTVPKEETFHTSGPLEVCRPSGSRTSGMGWWPGE